MLKFFAALPDKRPVVIAERPDYEVGDILRANCTIGPARPAANLTFYINDVPVSTKNPFLQCAKVSILGKSFRADTMAMNNVYHVI
jgi:hypothetical protein